MSRQDDFIKMASSERLFREVATRLRQMHFHNTGAHFDFGSFEFVIKEGNFVGIDECKRELLYRAPIWPRSVPA